MQCLGPYRLGEKVHSASLHRLDSHGDVAVASQEDNRLGITVSGESTLQVETARSRRAHIEDQAAGAVQYVGFKQFARRAKADRLAAPCTDPFRQRYSNGGTVLDNAHPRLFGFNKLRSDR